MPRVRLGRRAPLAFHRRPARAQVPGNLGPHRLGRVFGGRYRVRVAPQRRIRFLRNRGSAPANLWTGATPDRKTAEAASPTSAWPAAGVGDSGFGSQAAGLELAGAEDARS